LLARRAVVAKDADRTCVRLKASGCAGGANPTARASATGTILSRDARLARDAAAHGILRRCDPASGDNFVALAFRTLCHARCRFGDQKVRRVASKARVVVANVAARAACDAATDRVLVRSKTAGAREAACASDGARRAALARFAHRVGGGRAHRRGESLRRALHAFDARRLILLVPARRACSARTIAIASAVGAN
jgi:hypothetical protein